MKPSPACRLQRKPLKMAVIGAGPVGLALALQAARNLPHAQVSVFDARPLERDVSGDPRTLALSLGSVHLLERLGAWNAAHAQPIKEVQVSQAPPTLRRPLGLNVGEPEVRITAQELGLEQLGAVLGYIQAERAAQRGRRLRHLHFLDGLCLRGVPGTQPLKQMHAAQ